VSIQSTVAGKRMRVGRLSSPEADADAQAGRVGCDDGLGGSVEPLGSDHRPALGSGILAKRAGSKPNAVLIRITALSWN
jgi:hypothetical protein